MRYTIRTKGTVVWWSSVIVLVNVLYCRVEIEVEDEDEDRMKANGAIIDTVKLDEIKRFIG